MTVQSILSFGILNIQCMYAITKTNLSFGDAYEIVSHCRWVVKYLNKSSLRAVWFKRVGLVKMSRLRLLGVKSGGVYCL